MLQPGEGLVDFKAVLQTLRNVAGFEGPVCLEKVPGRTEGEVAANMGAARQWMEELLLLSSASSSPLSGGNTTAAAL